MYAKYAGWSDVFVVEDVQKFIRKLKDELYEMCDKKGVCEKSDIKWIINNLAGSSLVRKEEGE